MMCQWGVDRKEPEYATVFGLYSNIKETGVMAGDIRYY